MSETNLEHYKKELERILNKGFRNSAAVFDEVKTNCDSNIRSHYGTTYTDDILEWMSHPYKKPILDEAERKYLSAVIKPFKNNVTGIKKVNVNDDYTKRKEYIRIIVKKDASEYINLPYFKENTMYKGMKENKAYTLEAIYKQCEELGWWQSHAK